jgi:cytidylate kinase
MFFFVSHKYTYFLSTDGNYRLQRKNKRDDPDVVALANGNGYFAETSAYRRYLKETVDTTEVSTYSLLI